MSDISEISSLVKPHGLVVLGVFDESGVNKESGLVLVGNAGSAMWTVFKRSVEFADGAPDPLDRWSRRIGKAIATELGASVVFPFEGPPYPPFLDWAKTTGQAFPSPLSMYIHRTYGLWHAYRFALRLAVAVTEVQPGSIHASPCLSCNGQPCLDACPVDAFSTGAYRVDDCMAYLSANESSGCREMGCRARRACPVAVEYQYQSEHAQFHMDAFARSKYALKIVLGR